MAISGLVARRKSTPYKSKGIAPEAYKARRARDRDDSDDESPPVVQWWRAETGAEACSRLWTWVDRLRSQWAVNGTRDLIHEAIYADQPISRNGYFDGSSWRGARADGLCYLNVIKSLVDTGTSRLTKLRSMPCISADDADYSEKRFARKASRVLRRKMGGEDMERESPLVIRDALIRDAGVFKTEFVEGDTCTKRIPVYELVYDHREVQFGPPLSLAHVRPESREEMCRRFPEYEEQIEQASLFTRMDPWMQYIYQGPTMADLIEVAESWHPTPDGEGQHIVCIRGTCVLREPWCPPRYPVTFAYWTPPIRGLRGSGLVEEHAQAQDLINGVLADAREGIHEGSSLRVFASRGANVNKNHLRRGSPHVVEVDGAPGQIQFIAPDPVSKQAWAIAFQIKSEMYNLSGIPEWQAAGKSPLGEGVSGKALDTMNDNLSDRMASVEMQWQMTRVAVGRAHVDLAKHATADYEKLFDEQPDRPTDLASWIEDIDWSRVDIDGGDYHLTLEPVNFITGTRGGKLEEIAEAAKAGLIPDPTMTAGLMEEPDIQRMNRPILGPMNRIEMCLEGLADPKVPYIDLQPDDSMNLALAKMLAKGELEQAKADKAPDEVIQRFLNFLDDIKAKEADAAASPSLAGAQMNNIVAQPNAGTLGAPPPGPPMPPGPPTGNPGPQGMMQ